jgi:hypothetical protein
MLLCWLQSHEFIKGDTSFLSPVYMPYVNTTALFLLHHNSLGFALNPCLEEDTIEKLLDIIKAITLVFLIVCSITNSLLLENLGRKI